MPVPNTNLVYTDGLEKPVIPYRSNSSPTDDAPHFVTGSQNVQATISGWLQKRPGFSDAIETALSEIPGTIKRFYPWKKWAGSTYNPDAFIIMVSAVTANTSTVWKYQIGADASFVLLWTDATSTTPFDYVASNNFVFFGNATTRVNMRKYDSHMCTLWGLDAPISPPTFALVSGSLAEGLTANPTTGTISGTPTQASSSSFSVTVTDAGGNTATQTINLFINPAGLAWKTPIGALPPGTQGTAYSETLAAQSGTAPYTYSLFSGSLPTGLTLSSSGVISGTPTVGSTATAFAIKVTDSEASPVSVTQSFSLFINSNLLSLTPTVLPDGSVGSAYSETLTAAGGTSPYTYAAVGGGIPAGLSLDSTTGILSGTPTNPSQGVLSILVTDSAAHSAVFSVSLDVDATSLTVLTTEVPEAQVGVPYSTTIETSGGVNPVTFSFSAGSLTAYTGYVYGYTYTSIYGHESSMSILSANTGLFTDQDVELNVFASNDPQVNGINLYRSTDGGDADPSVMRLDVSLPNATQNYIDSTEDIYLGTQTGPALYINNPPQPIRGFVWTNGRIWGFTQATTWFTGNEEVTNGVPAECMSNATNGNYYGWPTEVGGLAVTDNGVDIALSQEWWQISGDTLATFYKSRLIQGTGTTVPTCVTVVGTVVYWIDTAAKQIWSSANGEIGQTIRPDLANIDPQQTFLVYHKSTTRNFLCILDGANQRLLIYDMDIAMWLTPWTVAATTIGSGQVALNSILLLAGFPTGHVRTLSTSTYDDDGVQYADQMRTGLQSINPGAGTKAANNTQVQQLVQWEVETMMSPEYDDNNNVIGYAPTVPDTVYVLPDDDPIETALTAWINAGMSEPLQFDANWDQRINLAARRWVTDRTVQMCRRAAVCAIFNESPNPWKVYSMALAKRAT